MLENLLPIKNRLFSIVNGDCPSLRQTKTLIVGVGGIGCEILKVLCKIPIGTVHIIDMDTIQLSNLNRQFLFKKEHKGMSKALMARQTILKINPDFDIVAHHKNIKELPINFFKQFSFLIMALDNIEARNYVNKIGVRLNIPIIDAGTLGYKGNVATIIPKVTKCYSCEPKSSQQKVFPVCTIRMRPQKPIHCIVWAKLLFEVLFGPQNDDNDLKDLAQLAKKNDVIDIMAKLFQNDILSIKNAKQDSDNKLSEIFAKSIKTISRDELQKCIGTASLETFNMHEDKLSEEVNIAIFAQSFQRLNKQKQTDSVITFQKDDDNIIHFISSAANLRMFCFNIERQSFNQVKNMAGNIVPAIASTNSIVSGIEIVEMMKLVKGQTNKMRSYYVQNLSNKVIGLKTQSNLQKCQVCHASAIPAIISINLNKFTLQNLVDIVKEKCPSLEQFSINYGSKQFFNSDDPRETLLQKSMFQLCSAYEIDLVITNEDTMKKVCAVWLIHDDQLNEAKIQNEYQFILKHENVQNQEIEEEENKNPQPANDDDDDMIIFDDDNDSPDLEIIEVKKQTETKKTQEENQNKNQAQNGQKQVDLVEISEEESKKQTSQILLIEEQANRNDGEKRDTSTINDGQKRQTSPMAEDQNSSDSIKKKVKPNDEE